MFDFVVTLLSSAAVAATLAAAVVFLTKSVLTERLKNAVAHEYAQKLEAIKVTLKAQADIALEQLKADNARNQAIPALAMASFTASHIAAHQRRLDAVETVWRMVLSWRSKIPQFIDVMDHLEPAQYDQLRTKPLIHLLDGVSLKTVAPLLIQNIGEVENVRPYISGTLFSLFYAYRVIIARVILHVLGGYEAGNMTLWYDIDSVAAITRAVLSPSEYDLHDKVTVGRFENLRVLLENKMLEEMARVISGEASASMGLDQARKIAEAASRVEAGA